MIIEHFKKALEHHNAATITNEQFHNYLVGHCGYTKGERRMRVEIKEHQKLFVAGQSREVIVGSPKGLVLIDLDNNYDMNVLSNARFEHYQKHLS